MIVSFHWQREKITPELLQDAGFITLTWAMIDNEITRTLELGTSASVSRRAPRFAIAVGLR